MTGHRQLDAPLTGHTGTASRVAFSPDGTTLVSPAGPSLKQWGYLSCEPPLLQPLRAGVTMRTPGEVCALPRVHPCAFPIGVPFDFFVAPSAEGQ